MPELPVKELDELTRLRIEFRAAKQKKTRKSLYPPSFFLPVALAIGYGYIAYNRDLVHLSTYIGAIMVTFSLAGYIESRTNEKFKDLERRLDCLADDLEKSSALTGRFVSPATAAPPPNLQTAPPVALQTPGAAQP